MINLIKKILNGNKIENSDIKIVDQSSKLQLAECILLLEIAESDSEFSDEEKNSIINILKNKFGLSVDESVQLIDASRNKRKNSIDIWQFANLINSNYSIEERKKIIETIWEIIYTDGKLDKYEDYLVHKLAKLLQLTHKQLIDAKLKALKK